MLIRDLFDGLGFLSLVPGRFNLFNLGLGNISLAGRVHSLGFLSNLHPGPWCSLSFLLGNLRLLVPVGMDGSGHHLVGTSSTLTSLCRWQNDFIFQKLLQSLLDVPLSKFEVKRILLHDVLHDSLTRNFFVSVEDDGLQYHVAVKGMP